MLHIHSFVSKYASGIWRRDIHHSWIWFWVWNDSRCFGWQNWLKKLSKKFSLHYWRIWLWVWNDSWYFGWWSWPQKCGESPKKTNSKILKWKLMFMSWFVSRTSRLHLLGMYIPMYSLRIKSLLIKNFWVICISWI